MKAVLLFAIVGCYTASPSVERKPLVATVDPTIEANRALHLDQPLDFDRPFVAKPTERIATQKKFQELCHLGDAEACRIRVTLFEGAHPDSDYKEVLDLCKAGDELSCRSLPVDTTDQRRFPGYLGEESRSLRCKSAPRTGCDVNALKRECQARIYLACVFYVSANRDESDRMIEHRYEQLGREGCAHGIGKECSTFDSNEDVDVRACLLEDDCWALAGRYKAAGKLEAARDALERQCEYLLSWNAYACIELGRGYVDGTFQEPRTGRGAALLEYACPKLRPGALIMEAEVKACEPYTRNQQATAPIAAP
ncbi:MAG: hypothetical protein QM831_19725 [Kofleriaceae bacterium]